MRRFEFVEGSSSKFWVPELQGNTFIVTYGRIGTAGQRKEKAFPDEESARREYERKVAEKLREGYKEVSAEGGEAPAPAPAPEKKGPPPRPVLPPRVRSARPTAEQVAAAAQALTALQGRLGKRSWQVSLQARRAKRALRSLGGVDPSAHASLAPVFEVAVADAVPLVTPAPTRPERAAATSMALSASSGGASTAATVPLAVTKAVPAPLTVPLSAICSAVPLASPGAAVAGDAMPTCPSRRAAATAATALERHGALASVVEPSIGVLRWWEPGSSPGAANTKYMVDYAT